MSRLTIGILADTHGLLRPEAIAALQDTDLIIHAGDVGTPDVLSELRQLAPLYAVRGNHDKGAWADHLPLREVVQAGTHLFYVVHEIAHLDLSPAAATFAGVISGHTHGPSAHVIEGVLHLDPGSAGPLRRGLPTTVAKIFIRPDGLSHEFVHLQPTISTE